jgi:two-component system, OmpR family, response regulator protein GraR
MEPLKHGEVMSKIFIIDDDKLITTIYSDFFATKGYIVSSTNSSFGVTNGIRALEPDVVILDMNLPGLSGRGLLNVIDSNGNSKIVLISSNSQETEMQLLIEGGKAHDYFVKGEPLDKLGHKIISLLGHVHDNKDSW